MIHVHTPTEAIYSTDDTDELQCLRTHAFATVGPVWPTAGFRDSRTVLPAPRGNSGGDGHAS